MCHTAANAITIRNQSTFKLLHPVGCCPRTTFFVSRQGINNYAHNYGRLPEDNFGCPEMQIVFPAQPQPAFPQGTRRNQTVQTVLSSKREDLQKMCMKFHTPKDRRPGWDLDEECRNNPAPMNTSRGSDRCDPGNSRARYLLKLLGNSSELCYPTSSGQSTLPSWPMILLFKALTHPNNQ